MSNVGQAVANTGLLVAAIRADESLRPDALFVDPLAEHLAGAEGRRLLAAALAETGEQTTAQIVIRTRFWDESLLRARSAGATQVVILAAGMDARAYRLPWPDGTTVYELDQAEVVAAKRARLGQAVPAAHRVAIGTDLTEDWTEELVAHGFDADRKTVWLVEGLLQYLDESAVRTLFDRVDALSAPGSVLLYDVVGKTLLDAPFMAPLKQFMAKSGAPWVFGTDTPAGLAESLGWSAVVTDVATPGNEWGRWPAPAEPLSVPGVPRGYFVVAAKPG